MLAFLKRWFRKREQQENGEKVNEIPPVDEDTEEDIQCSYTGKLYPKDMGRGESVRYEHGGYYSAECIWWVSEETDEEGVPVFIRESHEKIKTLPAVLPFKAAGKIYGSFKQFCDAEAPNGIYTDIYGREVLCYKNRFPCFDSYDYMNEHRYYRWFFLRHNGKLVRVYAADESGWIYVTEDVKNVERECAEQLKHYGWVK